MKLFLLFLLSLNARAAAPIGASYLNLKQIATPSSPAAGYNDLYFKSNSAPYFLTSTGVETQIGTINTVGTIDSVAPSSNGLVISGNSIYAQSASSTMPGLINNSAQQLSGVKTFLSNPIMSSLTASEVVATDSGKALTSILYAFTPTGTSLVLRDSTGNLAGNDLISGLTSVTSAAGTTVMTIASAQVQRVTGTSTQNFNLPDATTLINGWVYEFNNGSTQTIFVRNTSASNLATIIPGAYARFVLLDGSTANGVWSLNWMLPATSSYGTSGLTITGDLLVTGTETIATLNATTINATTVSAPSITTPTLTVTTVNASGSIISPVLSSSGANPASAGVLRLSNNQAIDWRNAANNGDNSLVSNASNVLTYNGSSVLIAGQASIVNADVNAAAAISLSKLGGVIIQTKTANYNVLSSDDVLYGSGSAFTFTLPGAGTDSGHIYTFQKTDASLANIVTVSDGGSFTTTLNTLNETIKVISNGSTYSVLSRDIPSVWNSTLTFTPASAAFGTIAASSFFSRRVGDSLEVTFTFRAGTTSTGDSLIALPTGVVIDTAKIQASMRAFFGTYNNSDTTSIGIWAEDIGGVIFFDSDSSSSIYFSKNNRVTSDTNVYDTIIGTNYGTATVFSGKFIIPVVGWGG